MIYVTTVTICFLVVGIAYLMINRTVNRYLSDTRRATVIGVQKEQYDAVKIVWPRNFSPCRAIRRHAGVLYLNANAPSLPLKDCDRSKCHCFYKYYSDRRIHARRVLTMPGNLISQNQAEADERRSGRDRRLNVCG